VKTWLTAVAAIAATLLIVPCASGQSYPNRPVRIVVPFAAGSATDIAARLMADELRGALGQSFTIDNKAGASARIGAEAVAKAAPDGYTLLVTTNSSHSANPHLYKKLNYDPIKDFAPVSGIMTIPVIVVVNPKLPVTSLSELIAYAKARPGKVSYGYGNSIGQVTGAAFAKAAAIDVIATPYKSSPQAMTDLMAGFVALSFATAPSAVPNVKAGKVRALGVSSLTRIPALPDVATIAASGLPGFEANNVFGMVGPPGLPPALVDRINGELVTALKDPAVRRQLSEQGAEARSSTPAEYAALIRNEVANWGKVVRQSGARID